MVWLTFYANIRKVIIKKKYILIGIGGFLGAVLRYLIKEINNHGILGKIPVNTLLINIAGSFILALVLTLAAKMSNLDENLKIGVTVGFLGAFTTFSTLCREITELIYQGFYLTAASYVVISVVIGIGAAYSGAAAAGRIAANLVGQTEKDSGSIHEPVVDFEAGAE
jgi:CrcB protein